MLQNTPRSRFRDVYEAKKTRLASYTGRYGEAVPFQINGPSTTFLLGASSPCTTGVYITASVYADMRA